MNDTLKGKLVIIAISFVIILGSCRSRKETNSKRIRTAVDTSKPILPAIKSVLENVFEFDYLSYKSKCDYKDANMDQSFTMNLRMKCDSILWISITAVGFEVARARLDKDSVKILNRLNKRYYVYNYDFIKKLSGTSLTLKQIQYLLTANMLFPPENYVPTAETFKFKTTEGYIENTVSLDKSKIIEQLLQHLVEKSNANVSYTNYKKVDKQQFPGNVDISVTAINKAISFTMENGSINTENIDAFPFDIPAKYEKGN